MPTILEHDAWQSLRNLYPWPLSRPDARWKKKHGWLSDATAKMLADNLPLNGYVVELGSWLGRSTRFILNHRPGIRIVCVDHWEGDEQTKQANPAMHDGTLYDSFLYQCWDYRERIAILKMQTTIGMMRVYTSGLKPLLIYVDASHDEDSVYADAYAACNLFPRAVVVGDDVMQSGVERAAKRVGEKLHRKFTRNARAWRLA